MADGIRVDTADLLRFVAELQAVEGELPKGSTKAIQVAAQTTKDAWRERLNGSEFAASGASVEYNAGLLEATVENSQGTPRMQGFVHAAEFGSPTVSPISAARSALEVGGADLAKGLGIAGERAVRRAMNT